MKEMIKTTHVYFEYRSHGEDNAAQVKAVNGVSLTVNQGDFVVVLGRNGSGKSTLARLMNALLIPKEGTVIVDGLDTQKGELIWEVRKTLGLVFQNPDNQIVATTVEEDVAFGPENLGIEPSQIRENVLSSLKLVGMDGYINHSPHMLSGGQKQRIAIAGILAMEPKCIVLDEATSMLDPLGRHEVLEVLHHLNRQKKITIVLITHHMDEAAQADKVFVMQGGQLVLEGSPGDIFEKVEAIRDAGLDVPQVTALAYELKKAGIEQKKLPISMEQTVAFLKGVLQGQTLDQILDFKKSERRAYRGDVISIRNLTHVYMPKTPYERRALDDVSLTIKKGEILGIIGHTGSGKSTLVQHFNGILKPSDGTLEVEGLKTEGKALKELRRNVGLIFQYPEHQLFEETVYKDITFGLIKMNLSEDEIKRRVFHVMELLGLSPELLEKSPFELSGGQKRRVAIAGVLVMEPKVLVLDEPTAGLDPKGSREVFRILSELNEKEETTIVIISHNMEDIAAFCDRVAVMHKGKLALCDTTRNVFTKAEALKSFGLDVPSITELFIRLNQSGYRLPSDVLTVQEAVNVILKTVERNKKGGAL